MSLGLETYHFIEPLCLGDAGVSQCGCCYKTTQAAAQDCTKALTTANGLNNSESGAFAGLSINKNPEMNNGANTLAAANGDSASRFAKALAECKSDEPLCSKDCTPDAMDIKSGQAPKMQQAQKQCQSSIASTEGTIQSAMGSNVSAQKDRTTRDSIRSRARWDLWRKALAGQQQQSQTPTDSTATTDPIEPQSTTTDTSTTPTDASTTATPSGSFQAPDCSGADANSTYCLQQNINSQVSAWCQSHPGCPDCNTGGGATLSASDPSCQTSPAQLMSALPASTTPQSLATGGPVSGGGSSVGSAIAPASVKEGQTNATSDNPYSKLAHMSMAVGSGGGGGTTSDGGVSNSFGSGSLFQPSALPGFLRVKPLL